MLLRFLIFNKKKAIGILNITDIDWKIDKRTEELGITPSEITDKYFNELVNDLLLLNIHDNFFIARTSDFLNDSIKILNDLIKKNKAYNRGGNIYLDNKVLKRSKKRSAIVDNDLIFDISNEKLDDKDILLWNSLEVFNYNIKGFENCFFGIPWWHFQDSSIIISLLNGDYDLHGGANELIVPHHLSIYDILSAVKKDSSENIIWSHIELLMKDGEKMSKSKGNIISIKEVLKEYTVNTLRLYLYYTNYDKKINFSKSDLDKFKKIDNEIKSKILMADLIEENLENHNQEKKYFDKFIMCLANNLDTHGAIMILQKTLKKPIYNDLKKMVEILGLKY